MVNNIYQICKEFLKQNKINNLNPKIFISGIAFKGNPETSDVRGSTAIDLLNIFKKKNLITFTYMISVLVKVN